MQALARGCQVLGIQSGIQGIAPKTVPCLSGSFRGDAHYLYDLWQIADLVGISRESSLYLYLVAHNHYEQDDEVRNCFLGNPIDGLRLVR